MKKLISLLLAAVMCAGLSLSALAAGENDGIMLISAAPDASAAEALNALGLFQGTDKGYELDRAPTRLEALIMLIRLSGKEVDALYLSEAESPFEDTPAWDGAAQYLGYAHENGLIEGGAKFDPNGAADAQMYITFVLKALGYTDASESSWEKLAKDAGLIGENGIDGFTRGDAAIISFAALDAAVQGETGKLSDKLMSEGVISNLGLAAARVKMGTQVNSASPLIDIAGMLYSSSSVLSTDGLFVTDITESNISGFIGEAKVDITEGIACEPMMTARAHSVCLLRLKDGADVEAAKREIAENANPRKWICVGVAEENVRVENVGNLVILIMDDNDPDGLMQAFKTLG